MSDIFFHYNVADKWGYACRWLRKAWGRGLRVGVVGPPEVLQTLDTLLWSSPSLRPTDFVAHALHGGDAQVWKASSIWLAPNAAEVVHAAWLLNLGDEVPSGFEQFAQVVEVVSDDELDRQRARQRWRQYKALGHGLKLHDLLQQPG